MRLDDIIISLSGVSLLLILGINIIFPPYVVVTTQESEVSRRTAAYGVLDENSTIYEFTFVSSPGEYDIQTQDTLLFRPPGWFNLTIRIPFEINENWTRIYVHAIFSTGTYGGVWFFWTLKWRLYDSSNVVFSDDWSDSLDVDPNRPTTLWRDNIGYNIGRDEKNSSIYTPGQWYWEVTLTVHNTTLTPTALKYQIYYNLFLEVSQQTSLTKPHIIFTESLYSTLTAGATIALVLGLHIIKRIKKMFHVAFIRLLASPSFQLSTLPSHSTAF